MTNADWMAEAAARCGLLSANSVLTGKNAGNN
jgi:hypothetical protein